MEAILWTRIGLILDLVGAVFVSLEVVGRVRLTIWKAKLSQSLARAAQPRQVLRDVKPLFWGPEMPPSYVRNALILLLLVAGIAANHWPGALADTGAAPYFGEYTRFLDQIPNAWWIATAAVMVTGVLLYAAASRLPAARRIVKLVTPLLFVGILPLIPLMAVAMGALFLAVGSLLLIVSIALGILRVVIERADRRGVENPLGPVGVGLLIAGFSMQIVGTFR